MKIKTQEDGFILPYVLVFIAVLSIVSIITANRLIKMSTSINDLQAQIKMDVMLQTAEAEAIYAIAIGRPVAGGIDLNPISPISSDIAAVSDLFNKEFGYSLASDYSSYNIWKPNGEDRIVEFSNGSVIISLQDVSGLLSLMDAPDDAISSFLQKLGLSREDARKSIASLKDYTDKDSFRRFGGAERLDYIVQKQPGPTNSPLRTYEELSQIMGWKSYLLKINNTELMRLTTLQPTNVFRKAFLVPELEAIFKEEAFSEIRGIGALDMNSDTPSGKYRLSLKVFDSNGNSKTRLVELINSPRSPDSPFHVNWIYEIPNDVYHENNRSVARDNLKDVIHSRSVHLPE